MLKPSRQTASAVRPRFFLIAKSIRWCNFVFDEALCRRSFGHDNIGSGVSLQLFRDLEHFIAARYEANIVNPTLLYWSSANFRIIFRFHALSPRRFGLFNLRAGYFITFVLVLLWFAWLHLNYSSLFIKVSLTGAKIPPRTVVCLSSSVPHIIYDKLYLFSQCPLWFYTFLHIRNMEVTTLLDV